MKPLTHSKTSARKYGGKPEDYLPIHDFLDSSKAAMPDMRHRAILHNSFGIFLAEKVFGTYIVNSDGKEVNVRDVAEDHVLDDIGFIPTIQDWLKDMPFTEWTGGLPKKNTRHIPLTTDPAHLPFPTQSMSPRDMVIDGGGKAWREMWEKKKKAPELPKKAPELPKEETPAPDELEIEVDVEKFLKSLPSMAKNTKED